MKLRSVTFFIGLVLPLLCTGCGYHLSGNADSDPNFRWHTLYRDDVRTVAVPTFTNRTFYQGVEFRLTKAVINQLEAQSPYKIVPKEQADTILEGEIIGAHMLTVSLNRITAIPQEQMYSLVVRFTWRDLRTGKILAQRHDFEQSTPFYPTLGEDPFVGEQENIERLGLAIAQELQADWGAKRARRSDRFGQLVEDQVWPSWSVFLFGVQPLGCLTNAADSLKAELRTKTSQRVDSDFTLYPQTQTPNPSSTPCGIRPMAIGLTCWRPCKSILVVQVNVGSWLARVEMRRATTLSYRQAYTV